MTFLHLCFIAGLGTDTATSPSPVVTFENGFVAVETGREEQDWLLIPLWPNFRRVVGNNRIAQSLFFHVVLFCVLVR